MPKVSFEIATEISSFASSEEVDAAFPIFPECCTCCPDVLGGGGGKGSPASIAFAYSLALKLGTANAL